MPAISYINPCLVTVLGDVSRHRRYTFCHQGLMHNVLMYLQRYFLLNRNVGQDRMHLEQTFVRQGICCTLVPRYPLVLAVNVKGFLVHPDTMQGAHVKSSVCAKLGWEWVGQVYDSEDSRFLSKTFLNLQGFIPTAALFWHKQFQMLESASRQEANILG